MRNKETEVQKMLSGCPDFPTLRDVAAEKMPEVCKNRTPAEESVRSVMPGDSMEGHLYEHLMESNPYLSLSREELWQKAQKGAKPEAAKALEALRLQQLQQSDGQMPGRPGCTGSSGEGQPRILPNGDIQLDKQRRVTPGRTITRSDI